MPKIIPQMMKAITTINSQPEKMSSKIHLLVMMDIGGSTGNYMCEQTGLAQSRVSIIRNSPLFVEERTRQMDILRTQIIDKKSTNIAEGDPVETKLKSLAMSAVETYEKILSRDGGSDSVKKVAADSILDRAGYKAHTEKMKVSIEVTEKMASRFEEVLAYNTRTGSPTGSALLGGENVEPSKNDRETKVSIKAEMSE